MANLKEIKSKISSVKNTQKTTKAMKLVSSAKLTRTRQLSEMAKDYGAQLNNVVAEIAYRITMTQAGDIQTKALIHNEDIKVVDIVFITADKGLCGGFNIATIKTVNKLLSEYSQQGFKVRLRAIGRKGIEYFTFQGFDFIDKVFGLSSSPEYKKASDFAQSLLGDFHNGLTDKIVMVHNGFLNMLSQEIKVKNLLPVAFDHNKDVTDFSNISFEIEPDDNNEEVIDELIIKYTEFNIYYALLDSLAAEHSSRMQAMESASKNAKEKVNTLTVEYNKARQAAITTELIEIISGVEALK